MVLVNGRTEPSRKVDGPRLLDLFCCAGGASVGYHRAGFDVVGVDIDPQPHYPFEFIQSDVLRSPPTSSLSSTRSTPPRRVSRIPIWRSATGTPTRWPRLIEPVRDLLAATGLPYVIENVEGAPLIDPVVLCGTMFPELRVIRHRLFESNVQLLGPAHGRHPLVFTHDKRKSHYGKLDQDASYVQVTGGGNCSMANARAGDGHRLDDQRRTQRVDPARLCAVRRQAAPSPSREAGTDAAVPGCLELARSSGSGNTSAWRNPRLMPPLALLRPDRGGHP